MVREKLNCGVIAAPSTPSTLDVQPNTTSTDSRGFHCHIRAWVPEGCGDRRQQAADAQPTFDIAWTLMTEASHAYVAHKLIVLVVEDDALLLDNAGLRLAEAIRRRWPPIALVLTFGALDLLTTEMPLNSVFLSKPYAGSDLQRTLRKFACSPIPVS